MLRQSRAHSDDCRFLLHSASHSSDLSVVFRRKACVSSVRAGSQARRLCSIDTCCSLHRLSWKAADQPRAVRRPACAFSGESPVAALRGCTSHQQLLVRITGEEAHRSAAGGVRECLAAAARAERGLRITSDKDVELSLSGLDDNQGLEAGVIPESRLHAVDPFSSAAKASTSGRPAVGVAAAPPGMLLYPPAQRSQIRDSWCARLASRISGRTAVYDERGA